MLKAFTIKIKGTLNIIIIFLGAFSRFAQPPKKKKQTEQKKPPHVFRLYFTAKLFNIFIFKALLNHIVL